MHGTAVFASCRSRPIQRGPIPGAALAVIAALAGGSPCTTARAETLREALVAAYQSNPRLEAERARLRATDENVPQALAGYRPTVRGTIDYGASNLDSRPATTNSGAARPLGYGLSLSQNLFDGFRTRNGVSEAEATVRAGRENLRQVESTTLLDAVTAYVDVVRDQALVGLREQNLRVLDQELTAARSRRSVLEATITDVAQAEARKARAQAELEEARAALRASRGTYQRVIGHPPRRLVEPAMQLRRLPGSQREAHQIALRESPNVVSALYREQAARHAVDRVWGELLPEVRLEASVQRQHDPSPQIDDQTSATVAGRVSIPLYTGGGTQSRVRQAKHTHVSRLQEIEQARSETEAAVISAWSRLVAARARLSSDKSQVAANTQALTGVRAEEQVGQRTLLDVLNAEQELLDARTALVETRRNVVVAMYGLMAVVGRLNADMLALDSEIYEPEEHYEEVRDKWIGVSVADEDVTGRRIEVERGETARRAPRMRLGVWERPDDRPVERADERTGERAPRPERGVGPGKQRPAADDNVPRLKLNTFGSQ